jgi:hypothetical protein
LPAYLARADYKNPKDISDGPFQYAHDTKVPFWDWLSENGYVEHFNNYMSGYRQGKRSWMETDFYPVAERLGQGLSDNEDAVLLVDVGGGIGHDLKEFKAKHTDLPGRLILQERAEVITHISKSEQDFEATVHDFFTPQPIQGMWDDIKSQSPAKIMQGQKLTTFIPCCMIGMTIHVARS